MREVVVTVNHKPFMILGEKETVVSRHEGEVEEGRKKFVNWFGNFGVTLLMSVSMGTVTQWAWAEETGKSSMSSVEEIRKGFMEVIDVFTAVAEPILWFYAVVGCILMATGKNKDNGWGKLKNVGYAYIGIRLLPAFFVFMGWIANLLGGVFTKMAHVPH